MSVRRRRCKELSCFATPAVRRNQSGVADYQPLEPRQLLAFTSSFDGGNNTLTLTQTADDGAVTIDNNGSPMGSFRTIDGDGTVTHGSAANLVIQMLDNSDPTLNLQLDSAFAGNLRVELGAGDRTFNLTGFFNQITGNLEINGGTGDQTVMVLSPTGLNVGGDLTLDLGSGNDRFEENGGSLSIGNNMLLTGVNRFENDAFANITNNLSIDNSTETTDSMLIDNQQLSVGGNLTYLGGSGIDTIKLIGAQGTQVDGDVSIDLGNGNTGTGDQMIELGKVNQGAPGQTVIQGSLTLNASNAASTDIVNLRPTATVQGNSLTIQLASGLNDVTLQNGFTGTSVSYVGSNGVDLLTVGLSGSATTTNFVLLGGDDSFTVQDSLVDGSLLRVDFGSGNDTFQFPSGTGSWGFNTSLLNLIGFDAFFNATADQWTLNQTSNLGDLQLGDGGTTDLTLSHGNDSTTLPSAASILLNAQSQSGDVQVDFQNPIDNMLYLNLRAGDRTIQFNGTSPVISVANLIRIEASGGNQNIEFVTPTQTNRMVINLRSGLDRADFMDGTHGSNDLVFRGVDVIENGTTSSLNVANNLLVNTRFQNENSRLVNQGTMNVDNKLAYLGGDGMDRLFLKSTVSVGELYVDLGANLGSQSQFVDLRGSFSAGLPAGSSGNLIVRGQTATGGNQVLSNSASSATGIVVVDFSSNAFDNQITLRGSYSGTFGLIKTGTGDDLFVLDAVMATTDLVARLGDGADTLDPDAATQLDSLFADFGGDIDTFIDGFAGSYPFPATIKNLP